MKLKQMIVEVEEKLKVENSDELHKLLAELKKLDLDVKENKARDEIVANIKRKNDQIQWVNIKDV